LAFFLNAFPAVLGCDFSGVVEAVGSNVKNFSKGDAVSGYNRLNQPSGGSFQEYVLIEEVVLIKKPSPLSFEQAAAFSLGILTSGSALYSGLEFPFPSQRKESKEPEYILITGGSGYVASYGIQLATLSGFSVITTASPAHFEHLKKLGAVHVIDRSADLVSEVTKITPNLKWVYDTVGPDNAELAAKALTTKEPAHIACVVGKPKTLPANVTLHEIGVARYTPQDVANFEKIWKEIWPLAENGKFVPHPVEVVPKGLAGVAHAFQSQSSGKKLVIRIADTE